MTSQNVWPEHRRLARWVRVGAVASIVAVVVASGILVRTLFSGSSLGERLVWAPVLVLLALPFAIGLERVVAWVWTASHLLEQTLMFAGAPPSRAHVAWAASSPHRVERLAARWSPEGRDPAEGMAPDVAALVVGLERYDAGVRARMGPARRCAELIAAQMCLPDEERRLADWVVALRVAADAVEPGLPHWWVDQAFRAVPGAPHVPAQAKRVGALAGFAVEFGTLCAPEPHGLGRDAVGARVLLLEVGNGNVVPEVADGFRRVPERALQDATLPVPPTPGRLRLVPSLTVAAVAVAAVAGVTALWLDDDDTPDVLGVTVANGPPVVTADRAEVRVGETVELAVLANDTDPDADALSVVGVDGARLGSATVEANRVRYRGRDVGVDRVVYTVSDGNGHEATAVITVTVSP